MEQRSLSGVRIVAAGLVLAGLVAAPHVASGLKEGHTKTDIIAGTKAMTAGLAEANPRVMIANDKVAITATTAAGKTQLAELRAGSRLPAMEIAATPAAGSAAILNTPQAAAPNPESPRQESQDAKSEGGQDYLQKMRDAGYPLDLNKDLDTIVSLRSVGVTPEYAKAMAQEGWGVPSLKELVSLKAVGVTPEYVAGLKSSSAAPSSFDEVISEKSVGVTPEYAKAMSSLGLGTPTMHEVVSMKAVGITPEYVAELKAAGLVPADLHELISFRAVGVTPEYAKSMASVGFPGLSAHELVSLKAQGVMPEYVRWIRTTFPNADLDEVRKAAVFHIDQEFMNKAKAHSFNSTDLDKLVKLKMTGLLD